MVSRSRSGESPVHKKEIDSPLLTQNGRNIRGKSEKKLREGDGRMPDALAIDREMSIKNGNRCQV